MIVAEKMERFDQAHELLAPRLAAAGFELAERDMFVDQSLAWVDYRHRQDAATHLLSLTMASDGHLLAEFWCTPTGGRTLQVLGQAEWHDAPMLSIVGEVERWLQRFARQQPPSP
jgi:hypothetical protein